MASGKGVAGAGGGEVAGAGAQGAGWTGSVVKVGQKEGVVEDGASGWEDWGRPELLEWPAVP